MWTLFTVMLVLGFFAAYPVTAFVMFFSGAAAIYFILRRSFAPKKVSSNNPSSLPLSKEVHIHYDQHGKVINKVEVIK
jgi:hypothetical protein